jgi:hypothetical protein
MYIHTYIQMCVPPKTFYAFHSDVVLRVLRWRGPLTLTKVGIVVRTLPISPPSSLPLYCRIFPLNPIYTPHSRGGSSARSLLHIYIPIYILEFFVRVLLTYELTLLMLLTILNLLTNSRYSRYFITLLNLLNLLNTHTHTHTHTQVTWATNHLGHYVLCNLLLPKLLASQPARVVIVSSGWYICIIHTHICIIHTHICLYVYVIYWRIYWMRKEYSTCTIIK